MFKFKLDKLRTKLDKLTSKLDKSLLLVWIAVVIIIVTGALILTNGSSGQFLNKIKNFGGSSKDDLAKKSIDYINNNILSGQTASIVSASEESGLVKIRISIGGQEFDSYVSKDGKLLFPEAIKMEEGQEQATAPAVQNSQPTTGEVQQAPGCGI